MADCADGFDRLMMRLARVKSAMEKFNISCTHYFRLCECCLDLVHTPGEVDGCSDDGTCLNPRLKRHPDFEFYKSIDSICDECKAGCGEGKLVGVCSKKKIDILFLDRIYRGVSKQRFLSLLDFKKDGNCNCCRKPSETFPFCIACDKECVDKVCTQIKEPILLYPPASGSSMPAGNTVAKVYYCPVCPCSFFEETTALDHVRINHLISHPPSI